MKKSLIINLCIPFCVRQCSYCSYAYCTYDPQVIRAYGQALLAEIESCRGQYDDYEVRAVSIEGGSPALLGADVLSRVIRSMRRAFTCSEDLQISLETMPGDYSRALMEKMRDAGVNLWIIGLQTAQKAEHDILERPYRFDAVSMADLAIRTFDPRFLSFDLLTGIPGQTCHSLEQTLLKCLYYAPDHMTVYPLSVRPDTRLKKKIESGQISAVSPADTEDLQKFAATFLAERGFVRYTAYDYARSPHPVRFADRSIPAVPEDWADLCLNRYRLLYLQDCEYLGLGYHAASCMDGCLWENGHSLQEYIDHSTEIEITSANLVRPDPERLEQIRARKRSLLVPV